MSTETYLVGQAARLTLTITDLANAAVDSGVLRLKVKDPSGVTTVLTLGAGIVADAVGIYHADVLLPQSGTWLWRWEGEVTNPGAAEGQITVTKSRL